MNKVKLKAWLGFLFLAVAMGLLLFVPARTIDYWQTWLFLAVYFTGSLFVSLYLMKQDPALLQRRMRGGPTAEKQREQKLIMLVASLGFIALLVVPALDHRMQWSHIPVSVIVVGDILVALWWLVVFIVFRENSFASATIEVADGQTVVSTGPYAIVRHPMYAGGLLLVVGMPLALGSYWGLLPIGAMMPVLLWRLFDEERFLARKLPGYTEYCARVRWRLIPGVF
jgi:protein-S-isoprenylcysteine O-methyltransferase Ste14